AGLLGPLMEGSAYVDLYLRGRQYSVSESRIGDLTFLTISGYIHTRPFKGDVVSIPFLIDRRGVEEEIAGLPEYMMLAGAGLVLFAVLIGYFLANRFARPVQVLIRGADEVSHGNLQYRIPLTYRDEFQQLMRAFNEMAGSLDQQQQDLERRREYTENLLN